MKKPSKSARRELIGPSRCAPRTPGWILVRIPSAKPDGSCRDAREALDTVAHWPWAKDTRYIGHARGYHLFERPGPGGGPSGNSNPMPAHQGFERGHRRR